MCISRSVLSITGAILSGLSSDLLRPPDPANITPGVVVGSI